MTAAKPSGRGPRIRLLADIRPLRESAEYRRLWAGQSLSAIGSQMTAVALPFQVYALTHSTLAVGALGLTTAVPLIVVGMLGSTLADAFDRRKLVLVTSAGLAVVALLLVTQAVLDVRHLGLLYTLSTVHSCLFAIDQPARRTFIPRLLPPDRLPAAGALSQISFQASMTVGPLVAGVVIATAGLEAAYLLDAVTFLAGLYAVLRLRAMPPANGGQGPGLGAVAEGLRFARRHPLIAAVFLVDLNAMVLGAPRALFPAFAEARFDGGSQTLGLLYAAPAVGGVLASVFSGWLGHTRRQGRAMLAAGVVWGAVLIGFGLSTALWMALLMLMAAGACDVVSDVFRSTVLQVSTPDQLRGRLSGLDFVVSAGGPRLGEVRAGAVSQLTSPAIGAVSGGISCVIGAVILACAFPALRRYDARSAGSTTADGDSSGKTAGETDTEVPAQK
ncbi:MFS transporter [Streptomyces sp. NPDC056244]|uniref:MFS transporter n=1 Tax=Streptomyces sp. NPDC056244 TaxID=3345762 RepID=UPI0035D9BEA7